MKRNRVTPAEVWREYQKGVAYNRSIDLYGNVKLCENFYIGRQWEGLNAPDLCKPVINVLHRVVSYFISMIVSDDVGVSFEPWTKTRVELECESGAREITREELDARALEQEVSRTIENSAVKAKTRDVVRYSAVDGDAYLYFWFDESASGEQGARGALACELLDIQSVIFGNPYTAEIGRQPYIIIASPRLLADVRDEARKNGMSEGDVHQIVADGDADMYTYKDSAKDELCTVLTRLWRENGTIHAARMTQNQIIRAPWDTRYTRYPIASFVWDKIKNSYHGMSAILPAIPNQICINQLCAMGVHHLKTNVYPKILFDETKIPKWDNKVGQAIGVIGNPNEAIAASFRGGDMSPQVFQMLDRLMKNTAEYMGANDAALGNIKPDNTSAIIATQKASAMPLELQRLEFCRFTEEYIRIIIDMIRADYGSRRVSVTLDGAEFDGLYDFSTLAEANYNMNINVGQAAYWSELTQMQTADNLLARNIIPDPETYLEAVPDKYIRNKGKLLERLRSTDRTGIIQK